MRWRLQSPLFHGIDRIDLLSFGPGYGKYALPGKILLFYNDYTADNFIDKNRVHVYIWYELEKRKIQMELRIL